MQRLPDAGWFQRSHFDFSSRRRRFRVRRARIGVSCGTNSDERETLCQILAMRPNDFVVVYVCCMLQFKLFAAWAVTSNRREDVKQKVAGISKWPHSIYLCLRKRRTPLSTQLERNSTLRACTFTQHGTGRQLTASTRQQVQEKCSPKPNKSKLPFRTTRAIKGRFTFCEGDAKNLDTCVYNTRREVVP